MFFDTLFFDALFYGHSSILCGLFAQNHQLKHHKVSDYCCDLTRASSDQTASNHSTQCNTGTLAALAI
ncbi:hypothetical protein DTO96_102125 [Ephemeroptericola cinctiostellae]|uniref:Uncharacterized protein n=1 Tax=Ephemeroptericola cinctiostellae TaxID=2268024 RepID=A0A345DDD3_9BURK|nr:hypothetical protein DTO96_102125 [Ephemeroptericola cinctiostellae]